jgi:hypothetical protein
MLYGAGLENNDGTSQSILKKKYRQKETLTQAMDKPGSSQFWSGLMKVKPIFYKFCERILVSGNKTRFWEDVWVNKKALAETFPRLYDLTFNRNITVDKVVSSLGRVLIFMRQLWGDLANEWLNLLAIIHSTVLSLGDDKVRWTLSKKGFTVKYLYNALQSRPVIKPFKKLWVLKIPAKIKTFLWGLIWGRTLTKDNLGKRGWVGENNCVVCAWDESIDHLFFACPIARMIWSVFQCCLQHSGSTFENG